MIDSHSHLSHKKGSSTILKIITKFKNAGGKYIVDVATSKNDLGKCLEIQKNHSNLVGLCFGVHPERCQENGSDLVKTLTQELDEMSQTIANAKVKPIAIGETGYDIYRIQKSKEESLEIQKELFKKHVHLGKELSLPIVIHARGESNSDYSMHYLSIENIQKLGIQLPYYFHSFAGDTTLLKAILDVNGYMGINGIITYQNVENLKESIKHIPLEKMLLETDSPFLIPSNMDRNLLEEKSQNEPLGIMYIAKMIAKILGRQIEEIIEITTNNAKKVFSL